jgi:mono/diheme cytochrome c family protein
MRSRLLAAASVLLLVAVHPTAQSARTARAVAAAAAPARSLPAGNAEHGRYLAEQVAMCVECHSGRDGQGNIVETERYMGGNIPFAPPWPNNWASRAPRNKGLPGYDDGMALRLLTQGAIDRHGMQLRPPMPRFRMTPQDAADVIAFLRTVR